jgi:D-alanyl-D-alanine carboxypeptidase
MPGHGPAGQSRCKNPTHVSRRTFAAVALAGTAAAAALSAPSAPPAAATPAPSPACTPPLPALDPVALQAAIDDLEHPPATAAQLRVGGTDGRWYGTSGVADIDTRRPVSTGTSAAGTSTATSRRPTAASATSPPTTSPPPGARAT